MLLTEVKIKNAKPNDKPQKLVDGNGLYLFIPKTQSEATAADGSMQPTGKARTSGKSRIATKSWRYDFRFGDRRFTLTFGLYPAVGLADARERLREAKRQIANGINPALERRAAMLVRKMALEDTFEAISKDWYDSKCKDRSEAWRAANQLYLKRDLNPKLGNLPITQIDRRMLLGVLEGIKAFRGVKTAERVRQTAIQVFDHAIRKLKTETNPARALAGWEEIPAKISHKPLREKEIHQFLERVDADPGLLATRFCIKLLLLTFVRKTEIIEAKWAEFDLDHAKWLVPAERMKMRDPHVVPLSRQAISVLKQLKPISFGSDYLFPSLSTIEKPIGRSTLNVAFRRMGYGGKFTPHGIRATASTWLNSNGFRADAIERQLAHVERNRVRAAYNHADYLPERIVMMQAWADFVDPEGGENAKLDMA